jgi:cytochrome c
MMDSFELTKFAGAGLAALLLIFGTRTIVELREHGAASHGSSHGYKLAMPKEATAPAPAAGAAPATAGGAAAPAAAGGLDTAKVIAALASAKADNGAAVFKKCATCHSIDKGGANKVGPALWGVVNRAKAGHEGFGYSDALKAKGGNWGYEDLARFIHSPGAFVKGTKMVFAGIPDAGDIADLIAYLRAQADSPAPLPGK